MYVHLGQQIGGWKYDSMVRTVFFLGGVGLNI